MRAPTFRRRNLVLIIISGFVLSLGGCDTHSGSKPSIRFTSDNPNVTDNMIYLAQGETTEDTIELLLTATYIDADRAYGAAFDLDIDPTVLDYMRLDKGTFFEDKGQFEAYYLAAFQSNDNSKLVVGITQQGKKYGVVSQGVIARFYFKGLKAGTSTVHFSNNALLNPNLENIPGITWIGGTIRVER